MLAHTLPKPEFDVLHALVLKRMAPADVVAAATRLEPGLLETALRRLQERGFVQVQRGATFVVTPEGREAHAAALRTEMRDHGRQQAVLFTYRRFLELNPHVLDLASRWQVRTEGDREVPNDHTDPEYDRRCIEGLCGVHQRAVPVLRPAGWAAPRFGLYQVRLSDALDRILSGDARYFTGLDVESYHTLWFELHQDLLLSLGLRREQEGGNEAAGS